jgi:hypothetical protein
MTQAKSYYVYALIDPRDDSTFYIGKGKGNRMNTHVNNAKKGKIDNVEKYRRIVAIQKAGHTVVVKKVHEGLTEEEAYRKERELIRSHKHSGITNISGGIVTNKERQYQQAVDLLSRLLPFKEWLNTLDKDRDKHIFDFAVAQCGGMYELWESFKGRLTHLVEQHADVKAR